MATVYRENRKSSTRQYIATAAFDSYFRTYTLTTDPNTFITTGTFGPVTGASAANCPRGRILRETGERLFPGQSGVNTLMVKVFDPYSFLSGYIDPNAEVFAVYNTDKPGWVDDGYENNASSGTRHQGPSVLTLGDVISAGGQVRSSTVTPLTYTGAPDIDISLGQTFTITLAGNAAFTATNPLPGATVRLIVTSDASIRTLTGTGIVKMNSISTTANKVTIITFISDGTNLYQSSNVTLP